MADLRPLAEFRAEVEALSKDLPYAGQWGWCYDGSSDYSIGDAEDPQAHHVAGVYRRAAKFEEAQQLCDFIANAPRLLMEALAQIARLEADVKLWRERAQDLR